jgi:uncharacterized membrane protein
MYYNNSNTPNEDKYMEENTYLNINKVKKKKKSNKILYYISQKKKKNIIYYFFLIFLLFNLI